jgi:hypothetical protein
VADRRSCQYCRESFAGRSNPKPTLDDRFHETNRIGPIGPYPEEATRSLLRVAVSKDATGTILSWPSFETAHAEEACASSGRGAQFMFDMIRTKETLT